MPFIDRDTREGFQQPVVAPLPDATMYNRGLFASAFDLDNDVLAALKLIKKWNIPENPDFNLVEHAKDDPLFQQRRF